MSDTFSTSVNKGAQVVLFARLFPRYNPRSMTLDPSLGSGTNVYTTTIKHATRIVAVKVNSTTYTLTTLAGLATPTASRYYWDKNTGIFYLDTTGLGTFLPNSNHFVSIEYEVSVSNKEVDWYYQPNNSGTSKTIYYPYLSSFPNIAQSIEGNFEGFTPSISSSIDIANHDGFANEFISSASLSGTTINLYLAAGDLDTTQIKVLFTGTINSISVNQDVLSLGFTDQTYVYDDDAVVDYGSVEVFNTNNWNYLDPQYVGKINPTIYGVVDNHAAVPVEFNSGGANNNIKFLVGRFATTYNPSDYLYSFTVQASPAPTSTTIYLNTVANINPGDVLYDDTGGVDRNFRVQEVNTTSNYVVGTQGLNAITAGMVLKRGPLGYVRSYNTRTRVLTYHAMGGATPVATYSYASGHLYLHLSSSTFNDPPEENIFLVRVYGQKANDISGTLKSTKTGAYTKWFQLLYRYLTRFLSPTDIDSTFFTTANANATNYPDCGFVLPNWDATTMPTHKDVINQMLSTRFASAVQNLDGKISFFEIAPITSTNYTFDESDIYLGSFSYQEDSTNLAKTVQTGYRKQANFRQDNWFYYDAFGLVSTVNTQTTNEQYDLKTATNSNVIAHYKNRLVKRTDTIIQDNAQAQTHANRARTIYQYPYNTFRFTVSLAYVGIKIGETVQIELSSLPGYNTIQGSNTLVGRIVAISISEIGIELTCWDQIGVQQNQGVWA